MLLLNLERIVLYSSFKAEQAKILPPLNVHSLILLAKSKSHGTLSESVNACPDFILFLLAGV